MKPNSAAETEPVDYRNECFRIWAEIGKVILNAITSDTAKTLGKRLRHIANGAYIPNGVHGDTSMMAGLLNVETDTIRKMAARNNVPRVKPGDSLVFKATDFLTTRKEGQQ